MAETRQILQAPIPPPALVNFDPIRPIKYLKPTVYMTPLEVDKDGRVDCPETHFMCQSEAYCLPVYLRCNQINDCPGNVMTLMIVSGSQFPNLWGPNSMPRK